MSAQGKVISMAKLPPEFIRKAFPRTWYHPKMAPSYLVSSRCAERGIRRSGDRVYRSGGAHSGSAFRSLPGLIWTDSYPNRNRSYHPYCAQAPHSGTTGQVGVVRGQSHDLRRRPLVRVADVRAMIEVRAFKERTAAAQWLEVPLKTLECPL